MRIRGDKININTDSVCEFFDSRAKRFEELGLRSVLLGDQNPEYAEWWNEYEQINILPKLLPTHTHTHEVLHWMLDAGSDGGHKYWCLIAMIIVV